MLSNWDTAVIVFYLAFMFGMGFLFRDYNKEARDYFRGGGTMMWWMVGASAFMTMFSAWTFTGAAGKAYQDGYIVAVIFFGNALGYFFNYLWSSYRFRQMRVDTPIETVRDRFGKTNEQVFTWLWVPIGVLYAGIWLNGLAIFTSSVFQMDVKSTIWVVGLAVVIMSVSGGAWAVVASDFIQVMILMTVSLIMAFLALQHPAVGGLGGFFDKMPTRYIDWTELARPGIVFPWIIASMMKQFVSTNNMMDASRYVCVKDSEGARKAALLACVLMLIGPLVWFIPPMAAGIVEPNLGGVFTSLNNPSEAAYVFMGLETLPVGMIGLLVCGIFAATMSSMDSGLNRNAGIFVKSFYHPILKPKASSRELLIVGKIVSAAFGGLIILAALYFTTLKDRPLFDIMLQFGSLIALPYTMPLMLGMMYKRTPSWSGWTTVLVGFIFSLFTAILTSQSVFGYEVKLSPTTLDQWIYAAEPLTKRESSDFIFLFSSIGNIVVCSAWYFFTSLFYERESPKYKAQVDEFFTRMNTPIDFAGEGHEATDNKQAKLLGLLSFVYGGFILSLGAIIPNSFRGRLCFVFCGGFIFAVGALLYASSRPKAPAPATAPRG